MNINARGLLFGAQQAATSSAVPGSVLKAAEAAWLAQKVAADKKPAPKPKPAPDLQAGLMALYEGRKAGEAAQTKPAASSPSKPWWEWITHEAARIVRNTQDTAAQVVRVIQRTSASIVNDINMAVSKALFTPEIAWQELNDAQYAEVLQDLHDSGPTGQATADYIEARGVRIGLYPQDRSGAAWTWLGNIILPPDADLKNPLVLSGIVHETEHLQQPFFVRLSVHGELLAWQVDYNAYFEITGQHYGEPGAPYYDPNYIDPEYGNNRWIELSHLSPENRDDLARAQTLMIEISPNYQANLLPLQPIGEEITYQVSQVIEEGVDRIKRLFDSSP